ncbi:MAG: formamidopyrimidine-DNA glycosylase [Candidatus Eisenbacteria bacterium]|jgi:formamidopyrimidine-DNA glycosylase|nr:formamidopyrimidine-DNA glycosylase [Candidatus Eisenbacteria bacterium]
MPELPELEGYVEALTGRIMGEKLAGIELRHPFLLRTVEPAPREVEGKVVRGVRRIGKRLAIGLDDDLWLMLHLMLGGRLHWHEAGRGPKGRGHLAAFTFSSGMLTLTEFGTKKRASLHIARGPDAVQAFDRGGLELLDADLNAFRRVLTSRNHTLKRALTDPTLFSGIGNAYSDEILHRARLSPATLSQRLSDEETGRLYLAARELLREWITRVHDGARGGFPKEINASRVAMAVHGRYGQACPDCGSLVQRIRYAETETNYCARCQTGGRLLADRSLSRLLKKDWPRTLEELEERASTIVQRSGP